MAAIVASAGPTSVGGISPPAVPLCSLCDAPLDPQFSFSCLDCQSDDSGSTPCCSACSVSLHQPAKMSRHRLVRRSTEHLSASDATRDAGHGFCAHCRTIGRHALQVQLAVLECEGCAEGRTASSKALCLDCDQLVHQSLDADAHTRLTFAAPTPTRQTGVFTLGGVEGIAIMHQDTMESYAGRIWPGSLMLARYCEQWVRESLAAHHPHPLRGRRVVELGCGCAAIPSLACMLLGAREAVCTDMNRDGLDILGENIDSVKSQLEEKKRASNSSSSSGSPTDDEDRSVDGMRSQRLAFGEEVPQELRGSFDVILGSYILYDSDSFLPLVKTLEQLCPPPPPPAAAASASAEAAADGASSSPSPSPSPLVLLTSHEPTRELFLLSSLESVGFVWERVPFSLQTAQVTDELHTSAGALSNIGTGLRSTSILRIRRTGAGAGAKSEATG